MQEKNVFELKSLKSADLARLQAITASTERYGTIKILINSSDPEEEPGVYEKLLQTIEDARKNKSIFNVHGKTITTSWAVKLFCSLTKTGDTTIISKRTVIRIPEDVQSYVNKHTLITKEDLVPKGEISPQIAHSKKFSKMYLKIG